MFIEGTVFHRPGMTRGWILRFHSTMGLLLDQCARRGLILYWDLLPHTITRSTIWDKNNKAKIHIKTRQDIAFLLPPKSLKTGPSDDRKGVCGPKLWHPCTSIHGHTLPPKPLTYRTPFFWHMKCLFFLWIVQCVLENRFLLKCEHVGVLRDVLSLSYYCAPFWMTFVLLQQPLICWWHNVVMWPTCSVDYLQLYRKKPVCAMIAVVHTKRANVCSMIR